MRLYKDLEEERTAWLQRVQATLYHQGVPVIASRSSAAGQARLAMAELSPAGQQAVEVGLRQLDRLTGELDPLRAELPAAPAASRAAGRYRPPTLGSARSPRWPSGPRWRHPPLCLLR